MNMKKNLIYLPAIAAIMLLASCEQEESLSPTSGSNALKINASVVIPTTRAYDNKWNPNDEIGVYLVKSGTTDLVDNSFANVQYKSDNTSDAETCNFNAVNSSINLPADGSNSDVISYYPYSADKTSNGIRTFDLSDQTNQGPIDLLAAKAEGLNDQKTTANLTFTHKLTKIFFNIKAQDGISTDGLTARIGQQYTNVNYDILNDKLSLADNASKGVIPMRCQDGYCEAIIIPNTVDNNTAVDRTLDFTLGGVEYNATISSATSFEPGKKYVYNVTFSRKGVTVQGVGITDWVEQPGDNIAAATANIKNIYFFGDPDEWTPTLLTANADGTFTWTGNIYANQSFKFTLTNNGDFYTYQLMPNTSGTTGTDLAEGESGFYKVLYDNENDNKWKAVKNGDYTLVLNTQSGKVNVTREDIGISNLYIVGDATPAGWTMTQAPAFEKQSDGTYTLKITLSAGTFKLPLWNDHGFECDYLMPSDADATSHRTAFHVGTSMPLHRSDYPQTNDDQWQVSEDQAGTYTLTVDLTNNTITATKN